MDNQRKDKLFDSLPAGTEAALIQTEVNRFYFLDFDSEEAGTLLLLPNRTVYVVDSRYIELAQRHVENAEVLLETDAIAQVGEVLRAEGVKRLLVEDGITVASFHHLKTALPGIELDASATLGKAIRALRAIKDPGEVARMEEAQRITDACFSHILPFIKEGVREVDLMLEMESFMRKSGAQKVAFETICVAGPNTSLPHGKPCDYRVKPGDFITMDFGAKVDGYCTDMTRTVAFGTASEEQKKLYALVLEAHLAGIAAAKPGLLGKDVDKVARDIIDTAGYGANFGHGLGHSLGIEIHEEPRFSPKNEDVIEAGMMMTVEPGCYLPGRFGLRIEDTVRMTETGCVPLPKSPKELLIL